MNPNKYKRPGTNMPDFNGKAKMTCVHCQQMTEFVFAAWDKGRYTTLAFTEKSAAEAKKAAAAARKAGLPVPGESQQPDESADGEPKPGEVPF